MIDSQILKYKTRLDSLYARTRELSDDPELLSEWAKYLYVLTSGFIEEYIRTLYIEYVAKRTNTNTARYARAKLREFRNPKEERIYQLVNAFDPEWARSFRTEAEGELKDAVDSRTANRNAIAYGRDVNLTFIGLAGYYKKGLTLLKLLEGQVNA